MPLGDSSTDNVHADIGIACALPIELSAFLEGCVRVNHYKGGDFVFRGGRYDGIKVAVVESGLGYARARRAVNALVEGHTPDWLISCGFSGALLPKMKVGNIVMANEIVDQHGQSIQIDINLASEESRGLYVGRILTSDEMIRTVGEKRQLGEQHQAIAVDMESLAVAQVARERKLRFMAIRVISDDMSEDLPPEILSILGNSGAVRVGAALGSIFKRPGSVKEMLRLREKAGAASASLATFLDGIVHQLHDAGK